MFLLQMQNTQVLFQSCWSLVSDSALNLAVVLSSWDSVALKHQRAESGDVHLHLMLLQSRFTCSSSIKQPKSAGVTRGVTLLRINDLDTDAMLLLKHGLNLYSLCQLHPSIKTRRWVLMSSAGSQNPSIDWWKWKQSKEIAQCQSDMSVIRLLLSEVLIRNWQSDQGLQGPETSLNGAKWFLWPTVELWRLSKFNDTDIWHL